MDPSPDLPLVRPTFESADETEYVELMIQREVQRSAWQSEVMRRSQRSRAPELNKWGMKMLMCEEGPIGLVPGMLYRDSLARLYGSPGSAKSFLALDIALSLAAGRMPDGSARAAEKVVYVMAEGQRVNADRIKAWLSKHDLSADALEGWFHAVPEAVPLTEGGVEELVEWVHELSAGLVVLDTKNAMMVGDENSASDFATARRALDRIRTASSACVMLVDHVGHEGTRARGTSAATAAMDTEIRVTKDNEQCPAVMTAELTRDKAGEAGTVSSWRLVPEYPSAVLQPTQVTARIPIIGAPEPVALPDQVAQYTGPGARAIGDLARLMILNRKSVTGMARAEVVRMLSEVTRHQRSTITRAWSALIDMGYLESVHEDPTPVQALTGAHVWIGPA